LHQGVRWVWALLLLGAFGLGHATDRAPLENQKIDYLISAIEALSDAKFVRNDTEYDAKTAADHLRRKLKYAGSRVKSADDFIRYCATKSSMSGKPYEIRFSDGRVESSEAFLRQRLTEFSTK
jgi:hypothetical protein